MSKTLGERLAEPITISDEEAAAIRAAMDAARALEKAAEAAEALYGRLPAAATPHAFVHALEFHYGLTAHLARHEIAHAQELLALAGRT